MSVPDLLSVHGALSTLVFAVKQELVGIWCDVRAEWRSGTYLSVRIECREKNRQKVVDRLSHGALSNGYDYRFSLSYPVGATDPEQWVEITAFPDMGHDAQIKRKAA